PGDWDGFTLNSQLSTHNLVCSGAAGPVDDEAEEGGGGGKGEEEGVAETGEFAGAERQLKTLDGARRDVELRVAIDSPVHGAEEDVEVGDVGDAVVGDEVAGAEDDH